MAFKTILSNMLIKKSPDELIAVSKKSELKKTLNVFDLIVIGIGAVVGTGIFTIIGSAIQGGPEGVGAGPAIIISMVLAVVACVFSALCYSEIAAMIPVAGSAYTYTYATMGEFMAWMVGWILMLEYAIGNITVASAWTGYFAQFLKGFKHILPHFVTNFPLWLRNDYRYMFAFCDKYGLDPHTQMPFIFDKIPELDEEIAAVSEGWKLDRMGKVDLTIIRLALYEMRYDDQVPEKVAVNEAVEIAKKFGGDSSPQFVNGILAKLMR